MEQAPFSWKFMCIIFTFMLLLVKGVRSLRGDEMIAWNWELFAECVTVETGLKCAKAFVNRVDNVLRASHGSWIVITGVIVSLVVSPNPANYSTSTPGISNMLAKPEVIQKLSKSFLSNITNELSLQLFQKQKTLKIIRNPIPFPFRASLLANQNHIWNCSHSDVFSRRQGSAV